MKSKEEIESRLLEVREKLAFLRGKFFRYPNDDNEITGCMGEIKALEYVLEIENRVHKGC